MICDVRFPHQLVSLLVAIADPVSVLVSYCTVQYSTVFFRYSTSEYSELKYLDPRGIFLRALISRHPGLARTLLLWVQVKLFYWMP
jgi:hypothetical protein